MASIFYSWQSDRKPVRNKLGTALKRVCNLLSRELNEAERPELDSDTRGRFGSESISRTIFEKIDACDVFIADVTPILKSDNGKLFPNPNVMIEVGYALKTKPTGTKLYVVIADEEIDTDKMPFDIRDQHLYFFPSSLKPAELADELTKIVSEMLIQAAEHRSSNTETDDTPWIYVNHAYDTKWANSQAITFEISSDEDKEYFLESIKFGSLVSSPALVIPAKSSGTHASVTGEDIYPLEKPVNEMSIIVSRGGHKYEISQEVKASIRNDERYNIERIIPKPNGKRLK